MGENVELGFAKREAKMKLLGISIACMMIGMTQISAANASFFLTGNDLLTRCENKDHGCLNYLMGVSDMLSLAGEDKCVTEKLTAGQLNLIFQKYARNYPEYLSYSAAEVARDAINEYLCAPKKRK